jgi:thioesterase domain-containing protein
MEDGSGPIEYDDREALDALVRVFALTSGRTFRFDASLVGQCSADRLAELERRLVEWGIVPRSSPGVMQAVFRAFATCLRTPYRPTAAYPDPVSLVLVHDPEVSEEENLRRFDRTARGWELWAPRLAVSIAGGNHMTVLNEPHVQSLASLLEQQATPDEMEPEC